MLFCSSSGYLLFVLTEVVFHIHNHVVSRLNRLAWNIKTAAAVRSTLTEKPTQAGAIPIRAALSIVGIPARCQRCMTLGVNVATRHPGDQNIDDAVGYRLPPFRHLKPIGVKLLNSFVRIGRTPKRLQLAVRARFAFIEQTAFLFGRPLAE